MPDKIKIEKSMFEFALENHSFEIQYYLDLETGNIKMKSEDNFIEDEIEEEEIENNPERYHYINPIDSSKSYEIMEDFIYSLEDKKIKDDLLDSINRKKPFRSFKDRLYNYPEIQERWYIFYDEELERIMKEWLEENNINAELV